MILVLSVLTPIFQNRLQGPLRVGVRASRWSIIRWRYDRSLFTILRRSNFSSYSRHFVFCLHCNGFTPWRPGEVALCFGKGKWLTSNETWSLTHEVERFVDHAGRSWIGYPGICLNGLSRWRKSRICFTKIKECNLLNLTRSACHQCAITVETYQK